MAVSLQALACGSGTNTTSGNDPATAGEGGTGSNNDGGAGNGAGDPGDPTNSGNAGNDSSDGGVGDPTSMMGSGGSAGSSTNGGAGSVDPGGVGGGAGGSNEPGEIIPLDEDPLSIATGCAGVFNPDQVLDYTLDLAPGDWASLLADLTYDMYFEAQLSCGGEAPITVGVQRKRSGGAQKVGLKIDTNLYVAGQRFHDLTKLVFDNGVSSGGNTDDGDVGALASEYLGWRAMALSGGISARAAIASISVNGADPMAYVSVENVDKRFLENRLGNNGGWLYKKSGGPGDGLKTRETDPTVNPNEDYFCFWSGKGGACAAPSAAELSTTLPSHLDITQMLTFGAVNALVANTDSPLLKDNNYYYYDSVAGMRTYLPWDLDTTMRADLAVVGDSVPGGTPMYTDVLFSNWQADYVEIIRGMIEERWTPDIINQEIDRLVDVAGAAMDGDPYLGGSTAAAGADLKQWWADRLVDVAAQIEGL